MVENFPLQMYSTAWCFISISFPRVRSSSRQIHVSPTLFVSTQVEDHTQLIRFIVFSFVSDCMRDIKIISINVSSW